MKDKIVAKLGGTAAILLGIAYVVTGVAFLLQPIELQGGAPELFWSTLAQHPTAHLTVHWSSAVAGLLGLAVWQFINPNTKVYNGSQIRITRDLAQDNLLQKDRDGGGESSIAAIQSLIRPDCSERAKDESVNFRTRNPHADGWVKKIGRAADESKGTKTDPKRPNTGKPKPSLSPGNRQGIRPATLVMLQGQGQKLTKERT